MTKREWKVKVGWYYLRMLEWLDSPYRRDREYAGYVKRFLFGDGEISFDNEVWKKRKEERALPMPFNIYFG